MPEAPTDPKLMAENRLPLAGLRVLDLTLARAGPTCVRHLADWGADIIRVEPPGQGDGLGGARDGFDQVNLHRNKRGLSIDLKNPAGHAAFLKLAATADIVVENMRMQVKHRLKIAYDDLKELNPRLVYASISGFGQTGPYSKRGGVDQIAQGMGGLMTITGEPGRGPMRVGIPINDLTAGNLLAMGIMMKLYDRERTGQGRLRPYLPARGPGLHAGLPGQPLPDGWRGRRPGRQRPPRQHPDGRLPDHRQADQHRRLLGQALDQFLQGRRP